MVNAIVKIIIGLFLWRVVPGWITYGGKTVRGYIQLALNIIGVIMVIAGAISLLRVIL